MSHGRTSLTVNKQKPFVIEDMIYLLQNDRLNSLFDT